MDNTQALQALLAGAEGHGRIIVSPELLQSTIEEIAGLRQQISEGVELLTEGIRQMDEKDEGIAWCMRKQQIDGAWIKKVEGEKEAMKKALAWYGDESNYDPAHLDLHGYIPIDQDAGQRARSALSTIEGGKATLDPRGGDADE
ncbi:hypothetical protein [Paenibacillus daejeonensis]|uniref:hypothetical protein n=1 Tax=Paenibacillus daejeonensis TaxID=135193 RepID=UPI00038016C2|nr:hypothetical protein [Paenibacillus daejeonensis]